MSATNPNEFDPKPTAPTSASHEAFETAALGKHGGLVSEFMGFLKQNKKYWLLPLIIVMLLLAGLVILSSTAAAPFIYTLF